MALLAVVSTTTGQRRQQVPAFGANGSLLCGSPAGRQGYPPQPCTSLPCNGLSFGRRNDQA